MSNKDDKSPAPSKIKQEPGTVSSPSRASATASAAAASKRTFAPNVNIKREKKDVEVEKTSDNQRNKSDRSRQFTPNLGRGRGRGRGGNSNVIQTHSIFESGNTELQRKYDRDPGYSVASSGRVVGAVSASSRAKSNAEGDEDDYLKFEPTTEHEDLLLDDRINDEFGAFVRLPDVKPVLKEKKTEQEEIFDALTSLFNDPNIDLETLLFIQMPDCLSLMESKEGKIGKLKLYKSGKIELYVNEKIRFHVSLAANAAYLQDVVAVQTDDTTTTDNNGTITCLGHIKHKLLFTPILD